MKVYNFEVKDWHTYFVSNLNILVHNQGCGFTHSLYLEIFHALGEIGVKKFSNALQKGISGGGEGDTGIKKLDGKGKYGCMSEIKIQGKKGVRNARVYGNLVDGEYEWEVYKDSH